MRGSRNPRGIFRIFGLRTQRGGPTLSALILRGKGRKMKRVVFFAAGEQVKNLKALSVATSIKT
jgi:hypothetical protein